MGTFYDDIRDELDALDRERRGPTFGGEYSANSTVLAQVQTAINAAGYAPLLTIDGKNGPLTITAVQWAQSANGLTANGIVDDQMLGALGITPPTGTSIDSVTGTLKGAAAAAVAAIQQEYAPLLSWALSQPQPITQGKGVAPGFAATRASVVNSYVDWTTPLEGFLPFMYIDALGLVTTGMGNLVDPVSTAFALPWKHADGSAASQSEVESAWNAVDAQRSDPKNTKQTSGPATRGGGTQGGATTIRITKADVQHLVAAKMKQNETFLVAGLPKLSSAPADAQLAVHSMAWAEGPGFAKTWPQFDAAFNAGDYAAAAEQSHMQGTGIDMRNMANKLLLKNAAQVVAGKKDPDFLYYINGLPQLFGSSVVSPAAIIASIKAHPLRSAGIAAGVLAVGGAAIALALKKPAV